MIRPVYSQFSSEQAGDGQARSRCELIDFRDSKPYSAIDPALPDRAAMAHRSVKNMAALRSIADAVRSEVEPLLRDLGFNGEYPHYRRNCGGCADLISFQTNKNGGSFIVEIAQTSGEGVTPFWTEDFIPFDQLNVWHLDPHRDKRKRILAGPFGLLGWFHYDRIWQRIFLKKHERLRFAARGAMGKISKIQAQFDKWHRIPN